MRRILVLMIAALALSALAPARAQAAPPIRVRFEQLATSPPDSPWVHPLGTFLDDTRRRIVTLEWDFLAMVESRSALRVWTLALTPTAEWQPAVVDSAPYYPEVNMLDPQGDRIVAYNAGDRGALWELGLSEPMRWTRREVTGIHPQFFPSTPPVFDSNRRRMILMGGQRIDTHGIAEQDTLWVLSLDGVMRWDRIPVDPALHVSLASQSACYDPKRDRLLRRWRWPLDLLDFATMDWDTLRPSGMPLRSYLPVFDPIDDQLVGYGFTRYGDDVATFGLLRFEPESWWSFLSPDSIPEELRWGQEPALLADPHEHRVYLVVRVEEVSPQGTLQWRRQAWSVTFDRATQPVAECPRLVDGTFDTLQTLTYSAGNPSPHMRTFDWRIEDTRGWPGLPLSGHIDVPARTVVPVSVPVPVPYSATLRDTLTFTLSERGDLQPLDRCSHPFQPSLEPRLDVPRERALRGPLVLHPNPARERVAVSFSLPRPQSATLELLDIAGRVVERRALGVLAAGPHEEQLQLRAPVTPGVYLVRLRVSAGERVARLAIIR